MALNWANGRTHLAAGDYITTVAELHHPADITLMDAHLPSRDDVIAAMVDLYSSIGDAPPANYVRGAAPAAMAANNAAAQVNLHRFCDKFALYLANMGTSTKDSGKDRSGQWNEFPFYSDDAGTGSLVFLRLDVCKEIVGRGGRSFDLRHLERFFAGRIFTLAKNMKASFKIARKVGVDPDYAYCAYDAIQYCLAPMTREERLVADSATQVTLERARKNLIKNKGQLVVANELTHGFATDQPNFQWN